jgi:hypothetical protein
MSTDEPSETEQLLRGELIQSTAVFGNLLAISALRDSKTGRYKHDLANRLPDAGDSILRRLHQQVFMNWLSLSLENQERDIRVWIRSEDFEPAEGINELRRLESQADLLLPTSCHNHERKLFLRDLRIIIEHLTE